MVYFPFVCSAGRRRVESSIFRKLVQVTFSFAKEWHKNTARIHAHTSTQTKCYLRHRKLLHYHYYWYVLNGFYERLNECYFVFFYSIRYCLCSYVSFSSVLDRHTILERLKSSSVIYKQIHSVQIIAFNNRYFCAAHIPIYAASQTGFIGMGKKNQVGQCSMH